MKSIFSTHEFVIEKKNWNQKGKMKNDLSIWGLSKNMSSVAVVGLVFPLF